MVQQSGKNGTYLVQVENNWWLNPAYPEVRQFIADGAAEIAERYPVDGIHIDDYFYPTTDSSFDLAAFAENGGTDLTAFRLEQTNAMVQAIYQAVKRQTLQCNSASVPRVPCREIMPTNTPM